MRSSLTTATHAVVLCVVASMAGCGGPDDGTQVQITDAEVQKRSQGIQDAMKSGMYAPPPGATSKRK